MTRLIAAMLVLPAMATAQDHPQSWRADDVAAIQDQGGVCFVLDVRNDPSSPAGVGEHERTYPTQWGDVVAAYTVTENRGSPWAPGPCCDDTLALLDWPSGLVPDRMEISVPENGQGAISFTCWEGM